MFARVVKELMVPLSVSRRGEARYPVKPQSTTRIVEGCMLRVIEDPHPHPGYHLVQVIHGPNSGHVFYVNRDEVVIVEDESLVAA